MTRGVLYVATGQEYRLEANRSVKSLRKYHPDISVTLLTDKQPGSTLFDIVKTIDDPLFTWGDKIHGLLSSDYDRTLFLDTDTIVCGGLDPVYDVLEKFELAVAEDPYRETEPVPGVPDAYPEYNTGVIAYRDTDTVQRLVDMWSQHYFQGQQTAPDPGIAGDQPAFRKASYETPVDMTVLPTEYNCRYPFAGAVEQQVSVLHGRVPSPETVVDRINKESGVPRTFCHTATGISVQSFDWRPWLVRTLVSQFRNDVRRHGIVSAAKRAITTLVQTVEANSESE